MGKRENEGKKEKKQKKERKEKRKQCRGLYLNPILVPRVRVYACVRVRTRTREKRLAQQLGRFAARKLSKSSHRTEPL